MTILHCPKCRNNKFLVRWRRDLDWVTVECCNCGYEMDFNNLGKVHEKVIITLYKKIMNQKRRGKNGSRRNNGNDNSS